MTLRSRFPFAVLVPALIATTVVEVAAAQADLASLAAQTDQVFAQFDKSDLPGCVCAVMRDGEVVYNRAFGMANLELDVPLTPRSSVPAPCGRSGTTTGVINATSGRSWACTRR